MSWVNAVELIDSHCHLNFDVFDEDRDIVVQNARENGISRILNPGIDIDTSRSAIEVAQTYIEVYAAVGVHPNQGATWTNQSLIELEDLARNEKVVAIGEIGLDYYRQITPIEVQQSIFTQQLALAEKLGIPVVIHFREAGDDLINLLREWIYLLKRNGSSLLRFPGVVHSFSGDIFLARKLTELNFKLGISGPVTYKNSHELRSIIKEINFEHMLVETDAPFLSPHPNRSKRNEPANVRIVAEKIAEVKGMSLNELSAIMTSGADRLFNWRKSL